MPEEMIFSMVESGKSIANICIDLGISKRALGIRRLMAYKKPRKSTSMSKTYAWRHCAIPRSSKTYPQKNAMIEHTGLWITQICLLIEQIRASYPHLT